MRCRSKEQDIITMARWLLLLSVVLFSLFACSVERNERSSGPSAPALVTAFPSAAVTTPTLSFTAPTIRLAVATSEPTQTALDHDGLSEKESPATPELRTLPAQASIRALQPSVSVCAGEGSFVAEDGIVYTLGWRGEQPCASAIDLQTRSVKPVDPSALSFPLGDELQVSDPERARVYQAENGLVLAYDCCGRDTSAVLIRPRGEPVDISFDTALRFNAKTDQLYLSYQDFDGQNWITSIDLVTGAKITDLPVPSGPWTLAVGDNGAHAAAGDGRLFFSDGTTLVVLDGETLELVDRLSLSRRPVSAVLDPSGARLFVTDAGGDLHVLDSSTLAELDCLPGVGVGVDLDPKLGRLYVGDRFSGGVNVFDPSTLELLGRIQQPGRPIANPVDGQVFILEEDVYQADGVSLEVIHGRGARNSGCEGCLIPVDVVVDPRTGYVLTATSSIVGSKSAPVSQVAVDPTTGRAFVAHTTGGYLPVFSLALYGDLSLGEPLRWIDGVYGQVLYDPVSDQLYLAYNGRLLVFDGQTLELLAADQVGDDLALLAVDKVTGALYAAQGEWLLRFELRAAVVDAQGFEQRSALPGPVNGIVISPSFARDKTVFAHATDWATGDSVLYRSIDGGSRWTRAQAGLPAAPNDLVFAADGRLYAASTATGWRLAPEASIWGEGVYLSDDGGDTWRPDNEGLNHYRVGRLNVAEDGTLYARAAAAVEPGHAASGPTIWMRPPNGNWTPVTVPDAGPMQLIDYAIPATYTQAVNVSWQALTMVDPLYQSRGQELRRSDDGGRTWLSVGRGPVEYAEDVVLGSKSVYWLGSERLWRSEDEGATWAALRHSGLTDARPFSVAEALVDDAVTLFLGTENGRVLIVPMDEAIWEPVDH